MIQVNIGHTPQSTEKLSNISLQGCGKHVLNSVNTDHCVMNCLYI